MVSILGMGDIHVDDLWSLQLWEQYVVALVVAMMEVRPTASYCRLSG